MTSDDSLKLNTAHISPIQDIYVEFDFWNKTETETVPNTLNSKKRGYVIDRWDINRLSNTPF